MKILTCHRKYHQECNSGPQRSSEEEGLCLEHHIVARLEIVDKPGAKV